MPFIKKICGLFASWVLIFSQANAQNQPLSRESLLANPDILWLGETHAFVWLDSLENTDDKTYKYELSLLVYYDKPQNAWGSVIIATSQLVEKFDINETNYNINSHFEPIRQLKTAPMVSDIEKNPHFYAQYDCLLENVQVLKSTQTLTECLDMQLICAEEEAEKMLTFGNPQDSSHLSPEALRERLSTRDTIFSINKHPEYGDAHVWTVVCNTRLSPTEISKISFFMRWAWDANTQQIYCKNLLYAPILKHPRKPNFYEAGADTATHQTERPLFWKAATN